VIELPSDPSATVLIVEDDKAFAYAASRTPDRITCEYDLNDCQVGFKAGWSTSVLKNSSDQSDICKRSNFQSDCAPFQPHAPETMPRVAWSGPKSSPL
jgi:hypothetical protein